MVADRPQAAPDHDGNGNGVQWRSLDLTGNVRLLSTDDLEDGGAVATQTAPPEAQATQTAPPEAQATQTAPPEAQASAESNAAELPLASYDSLTLPSIRARLRGLDAGQLRVLVAYERTHAERPEVLGMFERRIERLETGQ
jgi:hypothetical protein